jgi:hypothetical protein
MILFLVALLASVPAVQAGLVRVFRRCLSLTPLQTSAAHRAGGAKLSRNVIQVSAYIPGALILADSVDGLDRRGY